jgi:SAM-dependent methyltransferase
VPFGKLSCVPTREELRPLLRCPECRESLEVAGSDLVCSRAGHRFGSLDGVPVLMANADLSAIDLRDGGGGLQGHDSLGLGLEAIDDAVSRGDLMLELGAGRERTNDTNVVRTDAFVFATKHLDLVADAHSLPFADASFDFVFSLAVFEHLHSPWVAAGEIARVLRPGGRVYTLCAFLQPLHGYPDHYFNATESGLRRLFADEFEIEVCGPRAVHGTHGESAIPLYRMLEMVQAYRVFTRADWRTRLRLWRFERALWTSSHKIQQLGDRLLQAPTAYETWKTIAPTVELLGHRK